MEKSYFEVFTEWLEPKFGLIAQAPHQNYDPGDTLQREGMVAVGAYILFHSGKMSKAEFEVVVSRYERVLALLNDPNNPGLLRRYPDPAYWGGLSDRLSRDQSVPNVIGMGLINKKRLQMFFDAHNAYSKGWFLTNCRDNWAWPPGHPEYSEKAYRWKMPDFTVLAFTASYQRAFEKKDLLSKMRMYLGDVETLINSIIKVHFYSKNKLDSDDLNHIMNLYQTELVSPTIISKLAFWYYQKRPFSIPVTLYPVPQALNPAQATMNSYFRYDNSGPKMEVFFEDVNNYMTDTFSWELKGKFE